MHTPLGRELHIGVLIIKGFDSETLESHIGLKRPKMKRRVFINTVVVVKAPHPQVLGPGGIYSTGRDCFPDMV